MNKNLISLDIIKNIIKNNGLNKYIIDLGYSKVKNKKYYVKTIDNKIINFGSLKNYMN
jgi:hypothetical protein